MDARTLWEDLQKIRTESPLIHNITNYVVMNTTANALLAVGASPIMAHAVEEVEEIVGISGALVINIGTLSSLWVDAMVRAGREAHRRGIPVVLDPVGSGATRLRTQTAQNCSARRAPTMSGAIPPKSGRWFFPRGEPGAWKAPTPPKRHLVRLDRFPVSAVVSYP
jgi:hydroxyethylthiazole kinase